jgi:peptidoglycan/LPS O-acetylase OafA/YrhL
MRRIIGVLVFALAVLIACEKPAYAYTDPGSVLLVWQIGASFLIGAAYYFRKFITRLIGKGGKAKKEDGVDGD